MKTTESELKHIFHPIEHAIICQWLGKAPPKFAKDVDIHRHIDNLAEGVIQLEPNADGDVGHYEVANAVARIVLSSVQHDLPQWAAIYSDKTLFGRDAFDKHKGKVSVLPQFVFEINWATSGPGYSWPVDYYVGFLPYYDVYVVTESADSPDAFGYTDRAIGYFKPDENILAGCERIITQDWKNQCDEYDQQQWEELWNTGILNSDTIIRMADSVWGSDEIEEVMA